MTCSTDSVPIMPSRFRHHDNPLKPPTRVSFLFSGQLSLDAHVNCQPLRSNCHFEPASQMSLHGATAWRRRAPVPWRLPSRVPSRLHTCRLRWPTRRHRMPWSEPCECGQVWDPKWPVPLCHSFRESRQPTEPGYQNMLLRMASEPGYTWLCCVKGGTAWVCDPAVFPCRYMLECVGLFPDAVLLVACSDTSCLLTHNLSPSSRSCDQQRLWL